uniref:Major facilitator superfamily (MFS) profile domain-containing protein n=1 Tax=Coccolithus braarudii TaxID=221442 RepID=A0A7S0L4H5_9EUKA
MMRTATIGSLVSSFAYGGYSLLTGSVASIYIFICLAGISTVGSAFSGASVTPFFSSLGNKRNMGRIMSVNSMMSSAGRVLGPPVFGALYALDIRSPYRLAAAFFLVSSAIYLGVYLLTKQPVPKRPSAALASADSARASAGISAAEQKALDALLTTVRETLILRQYDLGSPRVVELIKCILNEALPTRVEGRADEDLLQEEEDFLHQRLTVAHQSVKETGHQFGH